LRRVERKNSLGTYFCSYDIIRTKWLNFSF
jgi:hypothetical protein